MAKRRRRSTRPLHSPITRQRARKRHIAVGVDDIATRRLIAFKAVLIRLKATQRALALACRIPESRLSDIVRSVGASVTRDEKRAILRETGLLESELFPKLRRRDRRASAA